MTKGPIPEHSGQVERLLRLAGKDPEEWLSPPQLAWHLDFTRGGVAALAFQGKLPGGIKLGKRVFYPKNETLGMGVNRESKKEIVKTLHRSLGSDESALPEQLRSDSPEAVELMSEESLVPIPKVLLPKARTQAAYLRATAATVSLEDWGEVVKTALEHAKEGDAKARTWLSGYLIGTPIQRIAAIVEDNTEKFAEDERMKLLFAMMFGGEPDGESGAEAEAEGVVEVSYTDSSEVS